MLAKGAAVAGLRGCAMLESPRARGALQPQSVVVPWSVTVSDSDAEDPQQTCLCLPSV